jgi:uroporphyrinogen decarboxylase
MNSSSKVIFANEKFGNAIKGIPQKTPPIWFMRQAGRYHSHYRKLKEKYTFLELCKKPELAAEVALGPVQEFGFDVSILFSDLLFPLEAMGMGLDYNPGPILSHQLNSEIDIQALREVGDALPHLEFQKKALELTREILPKDVSLIGFLGGPWTLYTYATSGKHEGNLSRPKSNPYLIKMFYKKMVPLLKENLRLQIEGGAEVVMILDTAGGDLSPDWFVDLVVSPISELAGAYPGRVGYYTKGSTLDQLHLLKNISGLGGIGVDHRFSIEGLLKQSVSPGFLQGNFDQSLLFLSKDDFKKSARNYLEPIKKLSIDERKGWVSGLGHGVLPLTPEENVKLMIEMIREEFI